MGATLKRVQSFVSDVAGLAKDTQRTIADMSVKHIFPHASYVLEKFNTSLYIFMGIVIIFTLTSIVISVIYIFKPDLDNTVMATLNVFYLALGMSLLFTTVVIYAIGNGVKKAIDIGLDEWEARKTNIMEEMQIKKDREQSQQQV